VFALLPEYHENGVTATDGGYLVYLIVGEGAAEARDRIRLPFDPPDAVMWTGERGGAAWYVAGAKTRRQVDERTKETVLGCLKSRDAAGG
jgi:hypothetical protein